MIARNRQRPAQTGELVATLGPLVWSLVRRLDPEPEDAWQSAWEHILRGLPRFDPHGSARLSTWVATVTHRALVDRHRRRRVRGEDLPLDDVAADAPSVHDALEAGEREAALERAIAALPEAHRRVVVLHHLHGMPLEDIAATEGVALGTVKSRLHRARASIAMRLGSPP